VNEKVTRRKHTFYIGKSG